MNKKPNLRKNDLPRRNVTNDYHLRAISIGGNK